VGPADSRHPSDDDVCGDGVRRRRLAIIQPETVIRQRGHHRDPPLGIGPKQVTARSPRQNGIAESFASIARRDLLEHVIVFNERHLQRLLACFASYYLDDRTQLSLK
jgi:hypothetical protein